MVFLSTHSKWTDGSVLILYWGNIKSRRRSSEETHQDSDSPDLSLTEWVTWSEKNSNSIVMEFWSDHDSSIFIVSLSPYFLSDGIGNDKMYSLKVPDLTRDHLLCRRSDRVSSTFDRRKLVNFSALVPITSFPIFRTRTVLPSVNWQSFVRW